MKAGPDRSERPRLLVLASTYPRWPDDPEPGFVHELCRRLVDRFDVRVIAPHAPGARTDEVMDGVDVRRFRYAPTRLQTLVNDGGIGGNLKRSAWKWLLVPGFLLSSVIATLWAVVRYRPAVVHAHWLVPQGLMAALSRGLIPNAPRLAVTSHGADLFTLRGPAPTRLKRFVARRADWITVVSRSMLPAVLALGAPKERTTVRSMGVDLAGRFVADDNVPRSRTELLFVGRLVEKKGLRHLIDAMPAILRAEPDAHLTVVGFGPEESERRDQAHRLGVQERVTFAGAMPQERLPSFYARAAVLVAPFVRAADGDQEGLGLVAIEALACGCPVILGDVGAVADVQAAMPSMVDVIESEADAIANAVLRRLREGTHAASLDGLKQAFDWEYVARDYGDGLARLAERGRGHD
ncbi:glycosyltransferase [Lysobacter sp. LF1]|uniref:Glycosyltransferase n=1 Tax=Lysobacter stagni TaxID=3045172 RepID=A0ABT6XFA8_9GAMM|nr:glycosyltransferase [Lysobacter sp. LF1]MDI9238829.1 glycosyltransferase [Lysobacter sp. LF1]